MEQRILHYPFWLLSLLGTEDIILEDVPKLKDVEVISEVLSSLGAKVRIFR